MRVLACILAAGLAGCAQHSVSTMSDSVDSTNKIRVGYEQTEAIRFSPDDWPQDLYGDLYIPDYDGLKPAVLLVHGGGWESRSRYDMNAQARRAARQGFVVLNIDYRFAPEFPFPASLHDTQIAMQRHLFRHSGQLTKAWRFCATYPDRHGWRDSVYSLSKTGPIAYNSRCFFAGT